MIMHLKALCFCLVVASFVLPVFAAESGDVSGATTPASGKSYQIRNKKFGELLRPQEANGADGTPIVLYPAQPWKCMTWKLAAASESQFMLQNHFTSKTFAAAPGEAQSGAAVIQVPLAKKQEQRPVWQFTKLDDGSFKIVDSKTGKALTAEKSASDSGVRILLQPWNDKDTQKWQLTETDPAKLTM